MRLAATLKLVWEQKDDLMWGKDELNFSFHQKLFTFF